MTKAELRVQLLARRKKIPKKTRIQKEKTIAQKLKRLPAFPRAKRILCYEPHGSEVNLRPFLSAVCAKKKLILPRVNRKTHTLTLHAVTACETLVKGAYGVFEPTKQAKKMSPSNIDLALIPGVGFDRHGHRLGYGKGYFDRLLPTLRCPVIGIAFAEQIIDELPREPHDVPATMVLTDKEIITPHP